jgi:MoaA/NifB/PqqE/SkfB family radical SAM enzyme
MTRSGRDFRAMADEDDLDERSPSHPVGGTKAAPDLDPDTQIGKLRLSRAGVHWFDRASGLNILLDTASPPASSWSRAPRYASIALTNACELRCAFCYAPKLPARLTSEDVLAWALELDADGALGVGFGGGEPTAHPDFARICSEIAHRTSMAVTFTTHAHRMNSSLADALRGRVHFIRVSMDGCGTTYERIRGRPFAVFRRKLDTVATIAPFGLNVVVNDETVGELDAVERLAVEAGASELLFLPEQPVRARAGISERANAILTEWISDNRSPVRLAISEAAVPDGVPLANPFGDEHPLDAHVHIDAQGTLRPHAFAAKGVPIVGSLLDALDELRARRSET